jgi:hypothetical protein
MTKMVIEVMSTEVCVAFFVGFLAGLMLVVEPGTGHRRLFRAVEDIEENHLTTGMSWIGHSHQRNIGR